MIFLKPKVDIKYVKDLLVGNCESNLVFAGSVLSKI